MLRSGKKWEVGRSKSDMIYILQHKEIMGITNIGKKGFDRAEGKWWSKASGKERRELLQKEVRLQEEEVRSAKAVGMSNQGAWTKWEGVTPRKLSWNEILKKEPLRLHFLLKSVYDLLPSPVNLKRWGKTEEDQCKLCSKRCTLEHILSSCSVALNQGRYTWRHNKVLNELANILEQERVKKRTKPKKKVNYINFVTPGATVKPAAKIDEGLLASAQDWILNVDLNSKLVFPVEIVVTKLRPDMVMWSRSAKTVIIIELTVPWEERIEVAFERKRTKYDDLKNECERSGWKTWCLPVEVGSRGFIANSVWSLSKSLGLTSQVRKKLANNIGTAAERSSCWLWLKREELNWVPS